jgi:hypothetical protein
MKKICSISLNMKQDSFQLSTSYFRPLANPILPFTAVIYRFSYQARVFVPGKPFQSSLKFEDEAGAYQGQTLRKIRKLPP